MNRKIGLTILILIIVLQSFAQVKPFRFGVYVAPNIAWLSPDSEGYKADGSVMGFSWGFLADIALTENYFVKTGFSVDYMNSKLQFPYQSSELADNEIGTMHRKYNLRYLSIPVTIKMRTNQFNKIAYYGNIGFGTSFNLKAKGQDEFIYDAGTVTLEDTDIKDETTFVKGTLIVGAGAEYFLDDDTSLMVELSFNNGLSNILKGTNTVDPNIKQKAHLYYFQLSVGVMF